MKICLDLDGVICQFKKGNETYADILPVEGAVENVQALKAQGHYIIINTARHMKTCQSNLGLINARVTMITLKWLEKYNIPYDEIYFAKPHADIYIDDNAFRFNTWQEIADMGGKLPISKEAQLKST